MSRIKKYAKSRNVTLRWKAIVKWYEGRGSSEAIVKKAQTIISTHKLTAKSHGGTELYMNKFENVLQDFKDLDTPYDPRMAKISFLANIEDGVHKITKEILSMDDSRTYA